MVWELRLQGYSYPAIAKEMKERFALELLPKGWGAKHVYADCTAVLVQVQDEYRESAAEMVDVELNRFDQLLKGIWERATSGDLQAIDRAIDISKERRKMLGLDNPERFQVDWRVAIVDLMQKGTVTPDDVAQEFGVEVLGELNRIMLEQKE